jgi:cell shape-determining protein MreC
MKIMIKMHAILISISLFNVILTIILFSSILLSIDKHEYNLEQYLSTEFSEVKKEIKRVFNIADDTNYLLRYKD